jgi:4-carboxymuconolactone decarboxylase
MSDQKHAERRALALETLRSLTIDYVFGDLWSRPGLSKRDRSLIAIAALASMSLENPLRTNVMGGINHGLSPAEIREIISHLCGYAGFPRALEAMNIASEVLVEMGLAKEGEKLPPAKRNNLQERRALGAEGLNQVSGGAFSSNPERGLAALSSQLGDLGTMAVEFLYAEVWSREELSRRDRSLVVVSSLTALGRKDELEIHIPGAINHGVSKDELKELILMLSFLAGFPFAVEAMRVATEKLD